MAINARCSSRECHIDSYVVEVKAGTVSGTVDFTIVDSCNTLHDNCRAKAILLKVYTDWLEDQDESTDVLSTCRDNYRCVTGGPGMDYYNYAQKLVVTTALAAPESPLDVTVPLPLDCVNVFT